MIEKKTKKNLTTMNLSHTMRIVSTISIVCLFVINWNDSSIGVCVCSRSPLVDYWGI